MRNIKKGFSLVELMIVVAIIGILAAIAIPNFMAMQLKSKRAEVPGNVDGIKTSEMAYDAAFDGFIPANEAPRAVATADKQAVDWVANDGFTSLGWRPDGKVRGTYSVASGTLDFTVGGASDVDDDSSIANYSATTSLNATLDAADKDTY